MCGERSQDVCIGQTAIKLWWCRSSSNARSEMQDFSADFVLPLVCVVSRPQQQGKWGHYDMMDLRTMMPPRLLLLVLLQNATEDKKSALTAQFYCRYCSHSERRGEPWQNNEKVKARKFQLSFNTKMKHFMTKKVGRENVSLGRKKALQWSNNNLSGAKINAFPAPDDACLKAFCLEKYVHYPDAKSDKKLHWLPELQNENGRKSVLSAKKRGSWCISLSSFAYSTPLFCWKIVERKKLHWPKNERLTVSINSFLAS